MFTLHDKDHFGPEESTEIVRVIRLKEPISVTTVAARQGEMTDAIQVNVTVESVFVSKGSVTFQVWSDKTSYWTPIMSTEHDRFMAEVPPKYLSTEVN